MTERMRADRLRNPSRYSQATDYLPGSVPVKAAAGTRDEYRPVFPLTYERVNGGGMRGASGDVARLPPLRTKGNGAVPRS